MKIFWVALVVSLIVTAPLTYVALWLDWYPYSMGILAGIIAAAIYDELRQRDRMAKVFGRPPY